MSAPGADDAKRRRVEPPAPGAAAEEKKEEAVKEEPEQEEDAKPEKRPLLGQQVSVELRDCTLNVIPTLGGRVLTPLTDGGLQYLIAGARGNVGVKKGRYLYEVKILEALNPFEPANRGTRAPMPRQLVRVGFSTQDSSLFLGETEESVCFDSEGFFTANKTRSKTSELFGRSQTISVLLNVDRKSPNADTVSLFRDGVRVSQPQPLPENLVGKALFPHVNFKNVTLQVNFGASPMAPLPFTCRTWQEVAKDDAEARKSDSTKDGKYEVLFPIGLPDEGTFDWLDGFLQANPQYTEISDRTILRWAERSGLWRPSPSSWKNSNDKPDMNFGISMMDDKSVNRVLSSIIATQPRNYIIMEVKDNLLKEERLNLMKKFYQPFYKKVAMVVMGEPGLDFKAKTHESMLKEKQVTLEHERARRKVERAAQKAIEASKKKAEEARKKAEEEAAARQKAAEEAAAAAKKAAEEASKEGADAEKKDEEKKEGEAEKPAAEAPAAAAEEVKKEEEDEKKEEVKKEEESEEEPMPVAELTDEEKTRWFRKKPIPDLTMWVLGTTFTKFSLPGPEDGFDEVRYAWQKGPAAEDYLKSYVLKHKVLCRIEDLQPSDWFKTKLGEWEKVLAEWHTKQAEWKETSAKLAAEKAAQEAAAAAKKAAAEAAAAAAAEKKEGEEAAEAVAPEEEAKAEEKDAAGDEKMEATNIMEVQDVCDVGKGEPLFARFEFEDWALLSLRLELHLLVHAFRKDAGDPERIGIHESHLPFYYNKYYRKSFIIKHYGMETNPALVELVKDTVAVNPSNMVLEAQLSADLEGFDTFAKLTEEARRERTRRLDAGDETVKLRFTHPETLPAKGGVMPPPQQAFGGGQPKGGKPYYTPRTQGPYSGGKSGNYAWGGKPGGGPAGPVGKGYGGARGPPTGSYKGAGTYGKGYGK